MIETGGGYFGTHCHICHEAVKDCKCVKARPKDLTHDQLRWDIERKNNEINKLFQEIVELKKDQRDFEPHLESMRIELRELKEYKDDKPERDRVLGVEEQSDRLMALDEKEVMKWYAEIAEPQDLSTIVILKELCDKFGTKPHDTKCTCGDSAAKTVKRVFKCPRCGGEFGKPEWFEKPHDTQEGVK